MRRVLTGIGLLLTLGLAAGPGAGPAPAADPPKAGKVKAYLHQDGKHVEKKLDLSKPEDRQQLARHLEAGAVEKLENEVDSNIMDLRWDLGLWTLVVFVLLYVVLKKTAWGPILEGLQKREDAIRSAVEEAKLARAETARAREEFQHKLDEAFQKIPAMMDEARRDAQRLAEEMRTKAAADIQADRQRLRREIEMAKDQALQDLWNQAAGLATQISAKAIQRNLSEEDHRRLVDEALADLRKNKRKNGQG